MISRSNQRIIPGARDGRQMKLTKIKQSEQMALAFGPADPAAEPTVERNLASPVKKLEKQPEPPEPRPKPVLAEAGGNGQRGGHSARVPGGRDTRPPRATAESM